MARPHRERVGLGLMMVEDVLWGLYPILTHRLVSGVDPLFVAGVGCLAGSVPFWLRLAQEGRLKAPFDPRWRWPLVKVALLATVAASICFFIGTAHTSGLNASLLSQSEPIFAVILSALFLGERVGGRQIVATALLILGAIAVILEGGFRPHWGDLLVLIAPLFYQLGHLVAKGLLRSVPSVFILPAARLGLGGAILLGLALLREPELAALLVDPRVMGPLALYGVVIIGLEKWIWYEALKRLDLGKATALLVPSVGVGVLGAWIILGEIPSAGQLLGLVLMVVGLTWLALGPLNTEEA